MATCLLIVYNGYRVLFGSLHEVLDGQVANDVYERIARLAAEVPGVVAPEKCRVRKSGIDFLVELHIEVAPDITVREGHDIGHRVKDHLLAGDKRIKDVLIHIEPAGDAAELADSGVKMS
ncbi:MAG: cation transporter dimerization domain-containing protein [Pirellulales bacterium]